jgi:hypothetical protein
MILNFFSHISATKMMFWALARVSFRAAKIVSCNKNFFFMVYDQNYHNCSSLVLLGIRAFGYMRFSVEALFGIRAFGYTRLWVRKPFNAKLFNTAGKQKVDNLN